MLRLVPCKLFFTILFILGAEDGGLIYGTSWTLLGSPSIHTVSDGYWTIHAEYISGTASWGQNISLKNCVGYQRDRTCCCTLVNILGTDCSLSVIRTFFYIWWYLIQLVFVFLCKNDANTNFCPSMVKQYTIPEQLKRYTIFWGLYLFMLSYPNSCNIMSHMFYRETKFYGLK